MFIDNFSKNEKVVLIVQKPQNLFIFSKFWNFAGKDLEIGYKSFLKLYFKPPY
jgi:hypothetical protein